jgi:hypothetical protein
VRLKRRMMDAPSRPRSVRRALGRLHACLPRLRRDLRRYIQHLGRVRSAGLSPPNTVSRTSFTGGSLAYCKYLKYSTYCVGGERGLSHSLGAGFLALRNSFSLTSSTGTPNREGGGDDVVCRQAPDRIARGLALRSEPSHSEKRLLLLLLPSLASHTVYFLFCFCPLEPLLSCSPRLGVIQPSAHPRRSALLLKS